MVSSTGSEDKSAPDKKKRSRVVWLLIALAVLMLLFLVYLRFTKNAAVGHNPRESEKAAEADTLVLDSASVLDTSDIRDSVKTVDSAAVEVKLPERKPIISNVHIQPDSVLTDTAVSSQSAADSADSSANAPDSSAFHNAAADVKAADTVIKLADPCAQDTLAPWVYADPSGGLHRKEVNVRLTANKPCTIYFRFERNGEWKEYNGTPVKIMKNAVLYYKAVDACGKEMKPRSKRYEFDFSNKSALCPSGMEHIAAEGGGFCIDKYLWPNRENVIPCSFVSFYQAMDSCFSAGKRLCASQEWSGACAGPHGWSYLYGDSYEANTCVTHDTTARQAGSRAECRGYYEVFDMSGNLGEWTSTAPAQDKTLRNVMGGFWASGSQSRCGDVRYSYFPQNRHNPVGFRCCKDASAGQDGSSVKPKRNGR